MNFNYEPNSFTGLGGLLIDNTTQQQVASFDPVARPAMDTVARPATKPKKGLTVLPADFTPTNYSVILGRGKGSYNYVGNKRCRVIVKSFLPEYNKLETRTDRSVVVAKVINIIKDACPIGGFIKNEGGVWYKVSEKISREKIFTMFRDVQNAESRGALRATFSSPELTTAPFADTRPQPEKMASFSPKLATTPFADTRPQPEQMTAAPLPAFIDRQESMNLNDLFLCLKPIGPNEDDESLADSLAESLGSKSFYDIESCSLCTI